MKLKTIHFAAISKFSRNQKGCGNLCDECPFLIFSGNIQIGCGAINFFGPFIKISSFTNQASPFFWKKIIKCIISVEWTVIKFTGKYLDS